MKRFISLEMQKITGENEPPLLINMLMNLATFLFTESENEIVDNITDICIRSVAAPKDLYDLFFHLQPIQNRNIPLSGIREEIISIMNEGYKGSDAAVKLWPVIVMKYLRFE